MKAISVHVSETHDSQLKSLAAAVDRPVAELIREAMSRYLAERMKSGPSVVDLDPHPSGRLLRAWTRDEVLDEMRKR